MRRQCLFIFCTAAFLISLARCGGGTTSAPSPPQPISLSQKIKHVVVIFQENRTPDNLFHGLLNADIADTGINSAGQVVPLMPVPLANDYDLRHSHSAFVEMYDGGKMDGADKIRVTCAAIATGCPPPNPQFRYVNPSDVAPYLQLAKQFTFADRMFQTNQGPSFPAYQFIIAGTSAPTATSDLFAAENPVVPATAPPDSPRGCDAPTDEFVYLINPFGEESSTQYPCFEHPTLMDSLDSSMTTWKYYTPSPGSIWTGPDAIQHLRFGPDWVNNVVVSQTQLFTDISSGHPAQVSWVIPTGQASDHPKSNDGSGPSWVASIVNAIGNSLYWSDTAIFITWDDWGRVVRPCRASDIRFLRVRFSRSLDRRVPFREAGSRFSHHA